jgi:hypothetical protein
MHYAMMLAAVGVMPLLALLRTAPHVPDSAFHTMETQLAFTHAG